MGIRYFFLCKLLRIKITSDIWLELDPISSRIILNEKLIFSSLGF